MSFKIIQRLILGILLVVFSFVLGSEAAEGTKMPILMLASLGLVFAMNWLGSNAWVLIFVAPLVAWYLPLGQLSQISPGYLASAAILIYYIILYMMGYVRLKWRSLWFFDLLIALIFIVFVVHYIQRPVGVSGLGEVNGELGGNPYIACLFATIFYIAVSLIPLTAERMLKLLKVLMSISLALLFYGAFMGVSAAGVDAVQEGAQGGRFSMFMGLGRVLFLVLLCYNSPWRLATSLWKSALMIVAFVMVLLSGFREQMGMLAFYFLFACIIYRQLRLFCVLVASAYGTLLFLSETEILLDMPKGVQRAVSVLPGVDVDASVLADAKHSLEWRYVMWDEAMNPQSGRIKDYIWGDGFGFVLSEMRLITIQLNRGQIGSGDQSSYMEVGEWHSGYITVIHCLGFIGLGLVGLTMLAFSILALRVCSLYLKNPLAPAVLFTLIVLPGNVITFYISAGSFESFFVMYYIFGITKILYCAHREEKAGIEQPADFIREKYVPMMLRGDSAEAQKA